MTTGNKIMWKRGEIAPKEQFLFFSTLFYIYISNFRIQITYSFVKCGCSIYCFPHSFNSWYVEVRISRSISVSPLEFEITRVDCRSNRFLHWTLLMCKCFPWINQYCCEICIKVRSLNYIGLFITKTHLFKYTENFTTKKWQFFR